MRYLILIFLLVASSSHAQETDSPRPELITEGSRLLNDEQSAEDFLRLAREFRKEREFNAEEQDYLKSLSRKLAAPQASQICSSASSSLCHETPWPRENTSSAPDRPREVAESLRVRDKESLSGVSKGWFVAGALLVGGYLALKDKEIQIQWRSGAW